MRIYASAAVTADGYLDDDTPQRLIVSTPGDLQEVYRLRTHHDAILVGAETLRSDDPSLLLRDEETRSKRAARGLRPDIAKVTLTRTGALDPSLRFFTTGDAERYVFAERELPELAGMAEVIVSEPPLTAAFVVTELEKRGIGSLFIEGGARTLRMFADAGLIDTLRIARNPSLRLDPLHVATDPAGGACFTGDGPHAPASHDAIRESIRSGSSDARPALRGTRLDLPAISADIPHTAEHRAGMEISTFTFRPDTTGEDLHFLRMAIAESRRCTPSATSYCVGAVVRTRSGALFTGYTHETSPTHHAEQEAIAKALAAGADLRGGAIWSSMEPCSHRSSEPESCSQLIIRHGFSRVAFALYEPDCFVCCRGALDLRLRGIDVRCYPELGDEVRAVNAHLVG